MEVTLQGENTSRSPHYIRSGPLSGEAPSRLPTCRPRQACHCPVPREEQLGRCLFVTGPPGRVCGAWGCGGPGSRPCWPPCPHTATLPTTDGPEMHVPIGAPATGQQLRQLGRAASWACCLSSVISTRGHCFRRQDENHRGDLTFPKPHREPDFVTIPLAR